MAHLNSLIKMLPIELIVLLMLGSTNMGYSQNTKFVYEYDNSGNRIQRMYIVLKSVSNIIEKEALDTTSITDVFLNNEIVIYPNPTKGILQVNITGNHDNVKLFSLYTSKGTLIKSIQDKGTSFIIDLSKEPIGIYILVCQINNQKREWKIIKE